MGAPIDRTTKTSLDGNLINGITSDAPKVKANNDNVYNYVDGLNAAQDAHASALTLAHPDGSVKTAKIADGAVTTAKHADGSVTLPKLATESKDSANHSYTGSVPSVTSTKGAIDATYNKLIQAMQTSSVSEVSDARTSVPSNKTYPTLKGRLDDEIGNLSGIVGKHTTALTDIVYNINSTEGIDSTGTKDITTILNSVILDLCKKTTGHKKIIFNGFYKISGTVYLPTDVVLDLNGSTLVGNGYNTNTLFKSGIFTGTTVKEYDDIILFNTSNERIEVINGTIKDCGKAFDIIKMNRNCRFENLYFINCEQAVNAVRCYYTTFRRLSYRAADWITKDASENPCFNFQTENNVMVISHIAVQSRKLGMQIYDTSSGLNIDTCSFENSDVGFKELGNDIRNLKLFNCYIENCYSGMQLTVNAEVDNCFFNNCTKAIESNLGNKINITNAFLNCTSKVINGSAASGAGADVIELPAVITYDTSPDLSVGADMTPGAYSQITQRNIQAFGTQPSQIVINDGLRGQPQTFHYAGKSGYVQGTVPFCTVTRVGTGAFTLQIDTNITWEEFSFLGYHFTVQDNDLNWEMCGLIYGQIVKPADASTKTIALSNNAGMLRITLSTFNHPTDFYAINGVVRHL